MPAGPSPLREPEAWGAVFADFDDDTTRIYLLGSVDPATGRPPRDLVAYRFYLDRITVFTAAIRLIAILGIGLEIKFS